MADKLKIPYHIGVIMDGNRRWAMERNLPTFEGHQRGYQLLKIFPEWFFDKGVKIISVFVFSMENWNRQQEEVNYLMKLLKNALENDLADYIKQNIKLKFSGRIEELPGNLYELCINAENQTKDNEKGIVNICLNYGGRAEIVDAVKKISKKKIDPEQIHEGMIKKYLYMPEFPDPDMIIRTSGECRLSGFMLWESAYSEFLFINKYWPEFERQDVEMIITEFNNRKRTFGGD